MNLLQSTQRLVPNACEDLLSSIGVRAKKRPDGDLTKILARPQDYAAGIIDFSGQAMSGKVILLGAFDFFADSRPSLHTARGSLRPQSAADWIRVRDWTMELCNQLLGRIKNQLCTVGVIVEAKLPRAVSGHALLVTVRERKGPYHVYTGGSHDVIVWFEAIINDEAAKGPRIDPVAEGDVIHF